MPGLEHASIHAAVPLSGQDGRSPSAVAGSPAAVDGCVLGSGSTTPVERAVGTASPAVADGPLTAGVGRAVVDLQSAADPFPGRFEREAAGGSSSDIVRIGVELRMVFEGPRAGDAFAAVFADVIAATERAGGLERVSADGSAVELRDRPALALVERADVEWDGAS